jgi:hypothetical protein
MKSTTIEIEKRVNQVYEMLLDGYSRFDIVQYCAKNYNVQPRQADYYIAEANREMKENVNIDREFEYKLAVKRGEHLFNLMYAGK